MAEMSIKEIKAHSNGMAIEFDIDIGISFSDEDMNTEQFTLLIQTQLLSDSWVYMPSRWNIHINRRALADFSVRIWLTDSFGSNYDDLPENIESYISTERARQIRAFASVIEFLCWMLYVEAPFVDPSVRTTRKIHTEVIKPADGQQREIQAKMSLLIDYNFDHEHSERAMDYRNYNDTILLENLKWLFEINLQSETSSNTVNALYCKQIPLSEDGQIVEEENPAPEWSCWT